MVHDAVDDAVVVVPDPQVGRVQVRAELRVVLEPPERRRREDQDLGALAALQEKEKTAAALAVAVPAIFAYNVFAARLGRLEGELEGFTAELIALMAREGRI